MTVASSTSRLGKLVRSRRLAVGLIASVIGWSIVGTVVPQDRLSAPGAVAVWDAAHPILAAPTRILGLHNAYAAPLFLAIVALLAVSTAMCAWERTRWAMGRTRRRGTVTEDTLARLRDRPAISVPIEAGLTAEEALSSLDAALRSMRLRVTRGPKLLEASGGRWGLLGSPVFHWSLALLFVVVALGQLSRSEGQLGVPVGGSVDEAAGSYRQLRQGPLYAGHTGLKISASDLVIDYRDVGGQRRGPAPVIALTRGGAPVAKGRVYPNSPLRYGRLLVHMGTYGLWAAFTLETSAGAPAGGTGEPIDFDSTQPGGTRPVSLTVSEAGFASTEVTVVVPLDRSGAAFVERLPKNPVVVLTVASSTGTPVQRTLRPGQSMLMRGGHRLRLDSVGYYVRLSVADDWSVYPIYVLFVLAGAAISVAVFSPARTACALLVDGPDGPLLNAITWHQRGDPVFPERVEEALREAAGVGSSEKKGSE